MNDPEIEAILKAHAHAKAEAEAAAKLRSEKRAEHLRRMTETVGIKLKEHVMPLLETAAAQVRESGYQAIVSFAEDTGGAGAKNLWIVASVMIECQRGPATREQFDLKFLGEVDGEQDVWQVRTFTMGGNLESGEAIYHPHRDGLKEFAKEHVLAFLRSVFPAGEEGRP